MKYSKEEVLQFVAEEDVKFIRLAFCDIYGKQKNISIMPYELKHAFDKGIIIDASAINGFGGDVKSDLLLHPDADTLTILPWRPEHGKVVRMYCNISYPDGTKFENDTRNILIEAIDAAKKEGLNFNFGSEMEFYLFKLDDNGEKTNIPYDNAGYMDIAPEDKGENVRREICLTLEQMGIQPESSHHEEGPGQNEIDFKYSDPLSTADNTQTFCTVVNTVAARNGLCADFSPKPLPSFAGNGFHINISANADDKTDYSDYIIAGILEKIPVMTLFLNPSDDSYCRLGNGKSPKYISWSEENRSQLIRIPAVLGNQKRIELRSPDPLANPYLVFALIIYASLEAVKNKTKLPIPADFNIYKADKKDLSNIKALPKSLDEAISLAKNSDFIKKYLPENLIEAYC